MGADIYTTISVEKAKGFATLWLDRPDKLNALNATMAGELKAAVDAIETDRDIIAVVIRGRGKAFCAGGDLDEFMRLYRDRTTISRFCADLFDALTSIEASGKVYIAAINGVCVAGGLELMLACDVALAAGNARIGDGHLNFGQLPGAGASQRLPRVIGPRRTKQLLFSAELLTAPEAERIGLVNAVYDDASFDRAVETYVAKLLTRSRTGLTGAKRMLDLAAPGNLKEGLRREIDLFLDYATGNPDAMEGLVAFKEKRTPRFRG